MSHSSILAAKARAHQAFVNFQVTGAPRPTSEPPRTKDPKAKRAVIYAELTYILSDLDKAMEKVWRAEKGLDVIAALNADRYRQEVAQLRQKWQNYVAEHYGKDHPYYPDFR